MKYVQRVGLLLGLLGLLRFEGGGPVRADSVLINFDTDASGNPLTAPPDFNETTALTTPYSPLGVTFSGPGGNDGGAILNAGAVPPPPGDDSGGGGGPPVPDFGVFAYSGTNVLAFNRDATLPGDSESNGGVPRDPETIAFATPWARVSIFAAGGFVTSTFTMEGFDASGNSVGTASVTTQGWSLLSLGSTDPIASVLLTETSTSGDLGNIFLYDNLFLSSIVPEPASFTLLGIGMIGLIGYARLRRRERA